MLASKPTIGDVARAAGVSKGTVSLAYSGKRPVSKETRVRVFAAAASLDWQPSFSARALATSRTETIGLVLARDPNVLATDAFFARFIMGCEAVFAERDYGLALRIVGSSEAEEKAYRRFAAGRADGVILLDLSERDERFDLTARLGMATVALGAERDYHGDLHGASYVYTDDRSAVREIVRTLAEQGHERIAHVSGPLNYVHSRVRRSAFVEEMEAQGIDATLLREGDFTAATGRLITEELLGLGRPPTAICFANDLMAIAGMSYAAHQGFRIPEALSVTGFDDTDLACHLTPALTTVSTGAFERGQAVAETMLALLDGGVADSRFVDCTNVVVRDSAGEPPGRSRC